MKLCGTLFQPHAVLYSTHAKARKWEKNTSWRWIVVLTHVLKVQSLSCCLYTNPVNGGSLSTNLRSAIVGKPFGELQKLSPAFAETRLCKDHILPAYCGLLYLVGISQSRFAPSVSLLHTAVHGRRYPSFTVKERKKKITVFPLPFSNYNYITLKLLLQV